MHCAPWIKYLYTYFIVFKCAFHSKHQLRSFRLQEALHCASDWKPLLVQLLFRHDSEDESSQQCESSADTIWAVVPQTNLNNVRPACMWRGISHPADNRSVCPDAHPTNQCQQRQWLINPSSRSHTQPLTWPNRLKLWRCHAQQNQHTKAPSQRQSRSDHLKLFQTDHALTVQRWYSWFSAWTTSSIFTKQHWIHSLLPT